MYQRNRKFYRLLSLLILAMAGLGYITSCGIAKSHVYVVARDPSWYPLSLVGREANVMAFSDDLLWEIAGREGFKVVTVRSGAGGLKTGIDSGAFDAVLATELPNVFQREGYVFSDPYFYAGPKLVVPAGARVDSLQDMAGKEIGVQSGALGLYQIDTKVGIVFRFYDNIVTGLDVMLRGEIDGVIMDLVPAFGFAHGSYKGRIKVVGEPLNPAAVRLVTAKGGSEELVAYFNHGLRELKEDGTYQKLLRKWGLHQDIHEHEAAQ